MRDGGYEWSTHRSMELRVACTCTQAAVMCHSPSATRHSYGTIWERRKVRMIPSQNRGEVRISEDDQESAGEREKLSRKVLAREQGLQTGVDAFVGRSPTGRCRRAETVVADTESL